MKICALCGKEVTIDKYFSKKSTCANCGGDLHICLNCKFYSEKSHNKCLEPQADFQRSREKANFCDYFVYKDKSVRAEKEDFKRLWDELFKKSL